MTAQSHSSTFRSREEDQGFHVLRSRLVDEFARLELAVNRCLGALGRMPDPRKTSFGQSVTELSKAKRSPLLSKAKASALGTLARDCEPLQRLRASIVHGVMEPGSRSGEAVACFRNIADIVGNEMVCHVLTEAEFRHSIFLVRGMTRRVENSLNHPLPRSENREP
jgi:hypothetical protein